MSTTLESQRITLIRSYNNEYIVVDGQIFHNTRDWNVYYDVTWHNLTDHITTVPPQSLQYITKNWNTQTVSEFSVVPAGFKKYYVLIIDAQQLCLYVNDSVLFESWDYDMNNVIAKYRQKYGNLDVFIHRNISPNSEYLILQSNQYFYDRSGRNDIELNDLENFARSYNIQTRSN